MVSDLSISNTGPAASPVADRAAPHAAPSKPPLLLLPGLLCDEAVWAGQTAALASLADCTVPCYGLQNSIEGMARDVLAAAPAGVFSLAGHSMGGRVALEIVRLAPERVTRLALLDTGFQPLAAGAEGEREQAQRYQLLAMARQQGMRAMGSQWAAGMVHPERRRSEVFAQILDMIERSGPDVFAAQIAALLGRPDATPVLPTITCPTLLLCGRQDAWSPLARHEQMAELITGAQLAVVEEAGHMAPMEQPDVVARLLGDWLKLPA